MSFSLSAISIVLIQLNVFVAEGNSNSEPQITCVSQFDYDYKTLTKVVETEHAQRELKQTAVDQEEKVRTLTEKLNRLEKLHSVNVAFTAVISKEGLTGLGPGEILIFDKVITNLGNGYHGNSGIFEAPVSGLYVFNMDIMVRGGQRQYTQFVVNGRHLMSNYAKATEAKHYASSSRTLTISLTTGDKVWIQTPNAPSHGDGVVHGNGFSTFSGWLLTLIFWRQITRELNKSRRY